MFRKMMISKSDLSHNHSKQSKLMAVTSFLPLWPNSCIYCKMETVTIRARVFYGPVTCANLCSQFLHSQLLHWEILEISCLDYCILWKFGHYFRM